MFEPTDRVASEDAAIAALLAVEPDAFGVDPGATTDVGAGWYLELLREGDPPDPRGWLVLRDGRRLACSARWTRDEHVRAARKGMIAARSSVTVRRCPDRARGAELLRRLGLVRVVDARLGAATLRIPEELTEGEIRAALTRLPASFARQRLHPGHLDALDVLDALGAEVEIAPDLE